MQAVIVFYYYYYVLFCFAYGCRDGKIGSAVTVKREGTWFDPQDGVRVLSLSLLHVGRCQFLIFFYNSPKHAVRFIKDIELL